MKVPRRLLFSMLALILWSCQVNRENPVSRPAIVASMPPSVLSPGCRECAGISGRVIAPPAAATNKEDGLARAVVHFMTPDETFYRAEKGPIATRSDASGSYELPPLLPDGQPVLVSVLLGGNRRMIGFVLTVAGSNSVDVGVASTYVTEFFRAEAHRDGRRMSDYPQLREKLPRLDALTRELLAEGRLPVPDLTLGLTAEMNARYLAVFGSKSQSLSDLWAELLGRRPIAVTTVAGNYSVGLLQEGGPATSLGLNAPQGIAINAQGEFFISEFGSHILRHVLPDGNSTVIGIFRGDGSATAPPRVPNGVAIADFSPPFPRDVVADSAGNIVVIPSTNGQETRPNVLLFVCRKSGHYYGSWRDSQRVYVLGNDEIGLGDTASRFKDGPIGQARFRDPWGLGLDDVGNLYVADRRNNLIRRIGRSDGMVTTVAGRITTRNGQMEGDQLFDWDGKDNGDGSAAVGARLNRPHDVAWRRADPNTEELFIWEGGNFNLPESARLSGNAIRLVKFPSEKPAEGKISTIAGGRQELRGFDGDGGPSKEAKIQLVNPAISADVPAGGIATDLAGRYLYFCDTLNSRVREIDLTSPEFRIRTAAGGGNEEGDAIALASKFHDVSGLAVDSSGGVYFCDARNHVVRRINLQFGR